MVSKHILKEAFDHLDLNADGLLKESDFKIALFRVLRQDPNLRTGDEALEVLVRRRSRGRKIVNGDVCPNFENTRSLVTSHEPHDWQMHEELSRTRQRLAQIEGKIDDLRMGYNKALARAHERESSRPSSRQNSRPASARSSHSIHNRE